MNKLIYGVSALLLCCTLAACEDSAEEARDEGDSVALDASEPQADAASPCPSLEGAWELVSVASDAPALSQEFDTDPDYQEAPTLKILTDAHWMFIRQSSDQFIHAQGGEYTLDPATGTYTETVDYSAIPNNIGKEFTFECRLEGDSLWHHVGGLGDNRYNEVWRRVE